MGALKSITFPAGTLEGLRREIALLEEVTPFSACPTLAERVASIGIAREVGTINDELARFIFDSESGEPVATASLFAEFVEWNGNVGVKIQSRQSSRLELRARGFTEVTHPSFSYNEDGTIHSLLLFPGLIAKIAALEGVELVLVKSWALNSIFGGFDPSKAYYQTNFWELENNDSLLFANLVRNGRLALLGTHDLIAHVAGVRREAWQSLQVSAERVYGSIRRYFARTASPSVASLVLPYTIGVVLDDLAQPPTYGSRSHLLALELLLAELDQNAIPPHLPTVLTKFPPQFAKIIEASRDSDVSPQAMKELVTAMVAEIQKASLRAA
jgi:hypothetical protein